MNSPRTESWEDYLPVPVVLVPIFIEWIAFFSLRPGFGKTVDPYVTFLGFSVVLLPIIIGFCFYIHRQPWPSVLRFSLYTISLVTCLLCLFPIGVAFICMMIGPINPG